MESRSQGSPEGSPHPRHFVKALDGKVHIRDPRDRRWWSECMTLCKERVPVDTVEDPEMICQKCLMWETSKPREGT